MVFFSKAYEKHLEDADVEDTERATSSETFHMCKELASRLSSTLVAFGQKVNRAAALKVASEGLKYAFQDLPQKLPFLEAGVLQFSLKLGLEEIKKM